MLKSYDIQEISNLKIHGRTIEKASPLPLFWSHSGIEVNCTGSELWVVVETDSDFHEPWVASELNGALLSRQMLLPGTHEICLYRSMVPGVVKNVKFYRELQAMGDDEKVHLLVKGLKTDGEFLPVTDKRLRFEFIGDSITSGEGTYGGREDTEWLSMYMSSSRTYYNIIERCMDAECRSISQGGWGVYVGWDNDVRHNIPGIYEPVCGLSKGPVNEKLGAQNEYDFTSWVPDAIIINLGTNDSTSFNMPGMEVPGVGFCKSRTDENGVRNSEDLAKIRTAIVNFLKLLRQKNPSSLLLWAYGMLGYDLESEIKAAIEEYAKETGDKNVDYLALPDTTERTVGSHSHPGFLSHLAAADVLGPYLAKHFNAEYNNNFVL
ncbi:MAG: GDSL family lipase [Lachnospiraceae bacterium]|nr:GDSL family lipase [Lachnospiraceae bacterium]